MKRNFTTKIICYKKKEGFIAVALDFDLIDEGGSLSEALSRLEENILGYLKMCLNEEETDKNIYRKAPKKYFDLYDLFVDLKKKQTPNKFSGELTFKRDKLDEYTCCHS